MRFSFLRAKVSPCLFCPVKVKPLRGFAEKSPHSLRSCSIFPENLDRTGMAILFALKREAHLFLCKTLKQNNMLLTSFTRITSIVFRIIFWVVCFRVLSATGIEPLCAIIGIIMVKGIIRFIFRLSVLLVTFAMVFLFIAFLICI